MKSMDIIRTRHNFLFIIWDAAVALATVPHYMVIFTCTEIFALSVSGDGSVASLLTVELSLKA